MKTHRLLDRLSIFPCDFQEFFKAHPAKKYDLIISNPPFHLNSLESPKAKKSLAKHTGNDFFAELIENTSRHLTVQGLLWLILPFETAELVKELAGKTGLYLQKTITIHSFENDLPHREIIIFGLNDVKLNNSRFVIYNEPKIYSDMYINSLKDFFTIF